MLECFGLEVINEQRARALSATNLAYVGDAVYDLYIRTQLVYLYGDYGANKVNQLKIKCVRASKQAEIAMCILPTLSEVETGILKRGRNSKSQSVPKNAKLADYKYATGLEALLGYLALSGQDGRLAELLKCAWSVCSVEVGGDTYEC